MILFIDNPQFLIPLGQYYHRPFRVYNFSSLYSGFDSLAPLVTNMYRVNPGNIPQYEFIDTVTFDLNYANAILNTPNMFEALIKIVMPVYQGEIVMLLVHRDPYRDSLMESLIKLLQQRYSLSCWVVEDLADVESIHELPITQNGLLMIDQDIKTYDRLYSDGKVFTQIMEPICIE